MTVKDTKVMFIGKAKRILIVCNVGQKRERKILNPLSTFKITHHIIIIYFCMRIDITMVVML